MYIIYIKYNYLCHISASIILILQIVLDDYLIILFRLYDINYKNYNFNFLLFCFFV